MLNSLYAAALFACCFFHYAQAGEKIFRRLDGETSCLDLQNNNGVGKEVFGENAVVKPVIYSSIIHDNVVKVKEEEVVFSDFLYFKSNREDVQSDVSGHKSPTFYASHTLKTTDINELDIWQLNERGYLVNVISKDDTGEDVAFDRIEVLDKEGNIKVQTNNFESGTINRQEVQHKNEKEIYNIFKVKGTENAKDIFELLANPERTTVVEWAHTAFCINNDSIVNYVSTSHKDDTETSGGYLFNFNINLDNRLLIHSHNHTVNSPYPSGMFRNKLDKSSDIIAVTDWTKKTLKKYGAGCEPRFYIFDYIKRIYVPYDRYSRPDDFEIQTPEE